MDKPPAWTSFDVVAVLRGLLGIKRVGHGGTLDPAATGVLVILAGPSTKDASRIHEARKAYAANVRFGAETATDDAEGAVRRTASVPVLDAASLDALLERFRGVTSQVPPDYAAVKVAGRPAYARARSGEALDLAPRQITIARLSSASWSPPDLRLLIVCTGGTYVRSLARDLGRAAGSAAHCTAIRRLAVGGFTAESVIPLETLRTEGRAAALARLRPLADADLVVPHYLLNDPADRILGDWGVAQP